MYLSVINILIQCISLSFLRNSFVRSSVHVCVCLVPINPHVSRAIELMTWILLVMSILPVSCPSAAPMTESRRTIEPHFVSLFSNFTIKGLGSLCVFILWRMYFGGIQILMYNAEKTSSCTSPKVALMPDFRVS
jgi:hypothetical protein